MSVRVSEALQSKIESDIAQSKVDIKKNQDSLSQKNISQNKIEKDMTDLGSWSVKNSQSLKSMNQYALSAHKMSTLAEDFHKLLLDESEDDWVESSAPGEGSAQEEIPFNEFEDVNLSTQTSDTVSIDEVLSRFLSKAKDLRENGGRRDYHAEREAEELLEKFKIKRLRQDKIILEKKLERMLNPEKDVVIFKAEIDLAQKRAMPKIKPDLAFVVSEKIAKNPKPDLAAEKIAAFNHEQYMKAFAGASHKIEDAKANDPAYQRTRAMLRKHLLESFKGEVHAHAKKVKEE